MLSTIDRVSRESTLKNLHTIDRDFYKNLWNVKLLSMIILTVWRIVKKFIPTIVNLHFKRLVGCASCPRCGNDSEIVEHIFWNCSNIAELWRLVGLQDLLSASITNWIDCITWAFSVSSASQKHVLCCMTWAIWTNKNKMKHEKTSRSYRDTTHFIIAYLKEPEGIRNNIPTRNVAVTRWKAPIEDFVKVNFDDAYEKETFRSSSSLVVRDSRG